jgi:3-oxoadipate enol-lactonase
LQEPGAVARVAAVSAIPEIGRIEHDGLEVCYRSTGRGVPLVLVHAGIADSRMWWPQYEALSQSFRIIAPDLPGYGSAPVPDRPFSYAGYLHSLISGLRIGKAWMVGVSFGARVLLDYYFAHPGAVSGAVIVSPLLEQFAGSDDIAAFVRREGEYLGAGDLCAATDLNLSMWLSGPKRSLREIPGATRSRLHEMQLDAFRLQCAKEAKVLEPDCDPSGRLSEARAPLLVVYGDLDHLEVEQSALHILGKVPGAKLWVARGSAHLPSVELPELFNDEISRFIGTEGGRSGVTSGRAWGS